MRSLAIVISIVQSFSFLGGVSHLYMSLFPAGQPAGRTYVRHTFFLFFSGRLVYVEEDESSWGGLYLYINSTFDTTDLNKHKYELVSLSVQMVSAVLRFLGLN